MRILAIESSAKAASVAVCEDGLLLSQYFQASTLTHSRTLLAMAEDMLKNMELTIGEIDAVAVASGPGSFTGVRIGISAAKGIAWGADLPVCGVSTLEAMANHCADKELIISPVMDARRSQVYNAKFSVECEKIVRLCPDRAISIEELSEDAKSDAATYFLVGDGAEMCYNFLRAKGIPVILAPENIRLQSARGVARAALNAKFTTPDNLIPNYLRLSQAERERLERQSKII